MFRGLFAVSVLAALGACSVSPKGRVEGPPRASAEGPRAGAVGDRDPALAARADAALDAAVREQRVVGAVLLVARDGHLVYHRAVGLADREAGTPMREDAVFRYASVSKPIVAVAALRLVERGALSLDDDVARFLPAFRPAIAGASPTITVRHLLTHTSGLGYTFNEPTPDGPYHRADVSDGLDVPGRSWEDNAARLAGVPLRFPPGARFHYSLAIDVLGEVVARAAKKPLPAAIDELVARPLGLRDTGFVVRDPRRLVPAYADGARGPVRIGDTALVPLGPMNVRFAPGRALDPASYPSGGAGMVGTAPDLLAFLEALRTSSPAILSPEHGAALARDQLRGARPDELGPGTGWGFVSAIVHDPSAAGQVVQEGALRWGGAYGHTWIVDRSAKTSIVLLTNTAFEGMVGKITKDVEHAVYGR